MAKSKLKPGDKVVTNAQYARITKFERPTEGYLIKQTGWQSDVWLTMMDGFEVAQRIHSSLLVRMEVVKMDKTKAVKLAGLDWVKVDKVEHRAEVAGDRVPARIRQLDEGTFAVYRAGRYLGCEGTLAAAAERAKLGTRSEVNREMDWQRAHPDEQPLGLRVTTEERTATWPAKPVAGTSGAAPPANAPRASSGAGRGGEPGGKSLPPTHPAIRGASKEVRDANAAKRRAAQGKPPAGTKDVEIATLLKRGCTSEEVLRVTGWKAISMPAMAKKLGLGLRIEKGRKPFKYYGEEKKK